MALHTKVWPLSSHITRLAATSSVESSKEAPVLYGAIAQTKPKHVQISNVVTMMLIKSPSTVVGITATFLLLDAVAVAMRFAARRGRSQPLHADDWLSFAALVGDALRVHIFV